MSNIAKFRFTMGLAFRWTSFVALLALGTPFQPLEIPQTATLDGNAKLELSLPIESPGWDEALAGILSAFDKADVVALGASRGIAGSEPNASRLAGFTRQRGFLALWT